MTDKETVLSIYPNAILLQDTNTEIYKLPVIIVTPRYANIVWDQHIKYDVQKNLENLISSFNFIGDWAKTPMEAWLSARLRIERKMLKKLEE